jgi:hypothetical protein
MAQENATEEHVTGDYYTGDRMRCRRKLGAFWGGIWGLLFGTAADKFLLIAHGSVAEASKAQQTLHTTPVADLGVHMDGPMAVAGKV